MEGCGAAADPPDRSVATVRRGLMVLDQSAFDLVTVWTVSGVPVCGVMGPRRYRVARDRCRPGSRLPAGCRLSGSYSW